MKTQAIAQSISSSIEQIREISWFFQSSMDRDEAIETHRFLFRLHLRNAWELGRKKDQRDNVDFSYYLIKRFIEEVYQCDFTKYSAVEDFAKELCDLFSVSRDNHMNSLLEYQEEALRSYFVSDFFDGDRDRGEVILLFDQELERVIKMLTPQLIAFNTQSK